MVNNQTPSDKQLRLFGLVFSIAIIFWSVIFKFWAGIAIALLLIGFALFCPSYLNNVYFYWIKLITFINRIISHSLMTILFLLIITPIALIRRLAGHDPLHNKETMQGSYRIKSRHCYSKEMENPY